MLRGPRVTLRPVERDDIKRLNELDQNVELSILGSSTWVPIPLAAREKEFDKHLERSHDPSWFGIEVDGKLVGDIGLYDSDRRVGTSQFGVAIMDPDYVGQGYGREAIGLMLDWAFRWENYQRIWLKTWASNRRAIRCYEALGFEEEGRLRRQVYVNGVYDDVVLMGLLRESWQERKGEPRYA